VNQELWQKVQAVFQAARGLEPAERGPFLALACGSDQELRNVVEQLLADDLTQGGQRGARTVQHTEDAATIASAHVASSQTARLLAGSQLGPYKLISGLGAGGMGEVYRAHDPRLGRDVAIKVLPEHLTDDPQALMRFALEARAVAALSHPNILAVFDMGIDQGISYVVTELLEGESLGERLRRGPLPWQEAVDYGIAVAQALTAAHSKGLIHRDLKPDNIFITSDNNIKLLDFGIVRWKSDVFTDGKLQVSGLTLAGTLLGTVGYMSPEQVRAEPVDAPSDIFSLGCVLYEMLTGRRAFRRHSAAETLAAILKEQPTQPSRIDPQIPANLDRIVLSCLEKNTGDRFHDAKAVDSALRAVSERAKSSEISALLPLVPRDTQIDSIAVLPFENGSGNPELEYLTDGITESIVNSLSQLGNMRVVARSTVFKYKAQRIDPEVAGRALRVRAVLTGRVTQRQELLTVQSELVDVLEGSQIWGDRYTHEFGDIFVVQEVIAREITQKLRLKLSQEQKERLTRRYTENSEAYQLYLRGRYYWNKRTPEWMRKGIENFQLAIESDPGYALAYAGLADCFALLGSYGALAPQDAFQKAKSSALKALEIDSTLAEARTSLAFTEGFYDWDWRAAQTSFLRAIELSPGYPTAYNWYAYVLMAHGLWDEVFVTIRRALDLDPLALVINAQMSWALHLSRRYEEAIQQAQKTLELDPNFGIAQLWLGLSHLQIGNFKDAIAALRSAHQILGGAPIVLGALGQTYAMAGLRSKALEAVNQLAEQAREQYVTPVATAVVFLGLGELDRAFESLEESLRDRSWWLAWLKVDPLFDAARSDPRLHPLLSRVGLSGDVLELASEEKSA
jgi:serine/threonine protein kinase/tetratricopeptide (TPR) repeat protein